MKRIKSIAYVIIITVFLTIFSVTVSAASVTVSGGNYNVGQTFSVIINYNAGVDLSLVKTTVKYNSSVLKLSGIKGVDQQNYSNNNGKIIMTDANFPTTNRVRTSSYTLTFSAVAQGSSSISVEASGVDFSNTRHTANSSSMVSITKPEPSSNANLAALKVSDATLEPAFSAKTTNYTAIVKYPIEKVTISASVADGGATCVGAGTYDLQVGENTRIVTVTAPSGTKKAYTVVIKRLTEDETAALIEQERAADPTLVVIDGKDYHIKADLADVALPEGFTATTTSYKDGQLAAITDVANRYTLCYLTADDGSKADWHYIDESGEFKSLVYLNISNKLYILSDAKAEFDIPQSYSENTYEAANGSVKAYKSIHSELADFYILSCYVGGETAFYRYDSAQNTIQRAPDFQLVSTLEAAAKAEQNKNILTRFGAMNATGKGIVLLLVVAAIVVLVLIVLLIIKLSTRPENPMEFIPERDEDETLSSVEEPFDIYSVTDSAEPEQTEPEDEESPENISSGDDDF